MIVDERSLVSVHRFLMLVFFLLLRGARTMGTGSIPSFPAVLRGPSVPLLNIHAPFGFVGSFQDMYPLDAYTCNV